MRNSISNKIRLNARRKATRVRWWVSVNRYELKPGMATASFFLLTLLSSFHNSFFHEWTPECQLSSCNIKASMYSLNNSTPQSFFFTFSQEGNTELQRPLLLLLPSSFLLSFNWPPLPGHSLHKNKSLFPVCLLDPSQPMNSHWLSVCRGVCAECSAACDVLKHR